MMKNPNRLAVALLPIAMLFLLGCPKLSTPVAKVVTLGDPQLSSDFASTGAFTVRAVPIGIDGSVISLTDASLVGITMDSGSAGGPYSVPVNNVGPLKLAPSPLDYSSAVRQ